MWYCFKCWELRPCNFSKKKNLQIPHLPEAITSFTLFPLSSEMTCWEEKFVMTPEKMKGCWYKCCRNNCQTCNKVPCPNVCHRPQYRHYPESSWCPWPRGSHYHPGQRAGKQQRNASWGKKKTKPWAQVFMNIISTETKDMYEFGHFSMYLYFVS